MKFTRCAGFFCILAVPKVWVLESNSIPIKNNFVRIAKFITSLKFFSSRVNILQNHGFQWFWQVSVCRWPNKTLWGKFRVRDIVILDSTGSLSNPKPTALISNYEKTGTPSSWSSFGGFQKNNNLERPLVPKPRDPRIWGIFQFRACVRT